MEETVTLSMASKMAAKSVTTIRRWIKEGSIRANKNSEGTWEINTQTFRTHLTQNCSVPVPHTNTPTEFQSSTVETTRFLYEALHREQHINDELRKQIQNKDSEILRLIHEMKAMLEKDSGGLLSRWIRK